VFTFAVFRDRHRTARRAVLAGSAAYLLGERLGGTTGLGRRPIDAKAFYCTIAVAALIGMLINFVGIDPIKTLFWAAVLNIAVCRLPGNVGRPTPAVPAAPPSKARVASVSLEV
jgi:hypothetical protein